MSNETTEPDEGTGATETASTTADEQPPAETGDTDRGSETSVADSGTETSAAETGAVDDAGEGVDGTVDALADLAGESDSQHGMVPTDTVFELLASPGNRFVLTYLIRVEDPASRDDLVEYVVERADPPDGLSEGTFRGRVAARLVHSNLPKLAEAGIVELDDDAGTVSSTPAVEELAPYLALAISRTEP